jgi:C-terminal processing protease CtpA/Prc
MTRSRNLLLILLFFSSNILWCSRLVEKVNEQQLLLKTRYLISFAKLYGYIRFFHPSDEAAKLDWNRFAIYGASKVKDAKDENELKTILEELFLPVAPTLQLTTNGDELKNKKLFQPENYSDYKIVAWQHFGVYLSNQTKMYKSTRIYKAPDYKNIPNFRIPLLPSQAIQWRYNGIELFDNYPQVNETYSAKLDSNLYCNFPLVLFSNKTGTIPKGNQTTLQLLINKLKETDTTFANQNMRLGNVINAWNVFQHFYPYFDVVQVDWNKVLTETLLDVFNNKTEDDFYITLKKMVAKLEDGHGVVYYKPQLPWGNIPIRIEYIEDNLVVTASEDSLFKKGDIIKSINGVDGKTALTKKEKIVSGSEQLRRYRALNILLDGKVDSIITIELLREGKEFNIKQKRSEPKTSLFFNRVTEFDYPHIKKMKDNIYYINLSSAEDKEFFDSLNVLSNANGIILDWRVSNFNMSKNKRLDYITMISFFIDSAVVSAKWNIPSVIYPDRNKITFNQTSWSLPPKKPQFKGKVVYITDPSAVSSAETALGIVENYKLAEIVGTTTAGANGNANYIVLPGGIRIMFTGMKVLKHDGSQHHLTGIKPTYPVTKTIKAVKEGRDEYLDKAIEVLNKKIKN